jgi:osmotically-inducible protein OsmY
VSKGTEISSDVELVANVADRLASDGALDPKAIAVSVQDGRVTLRGTVGSLREKRAAKQAAERVFGVVAVHDELEVRLMNAQKRADADLRADVFRALMLDSLVPDTIDVNVRDGRVTLTGAANWQYQRDEADLVASSIVGALDVRDEIELTHPPSSDPAAVVAPRPEPHRASMRRTFIIASALKPQVAARVAAEAPNPIDLLVISPTPLAREAAAIAVGGRFVSTVEEPRLAPRVPAESGGDVLARLAHVLRGLANYETDALLVVVDSLDVLGAGVFVLDEEGVARAAGDLERLLPLG